MESIKRKRLLVLGGSTWKEAIRSVAREHGIYLIAAAPYHVGIFDIADESYLLDVMNPEVMVPFIKDHHIDGIYRGGRNRLLMLLVSILMSWGCLVIVRVNSGNWFRISITSKLCVRNLDYLSSQNMN